MNVCTFDAYQKKYYVNCIILLISSHIVIRQKLHQYLATPSSMVFTTPYEDTYQQQDYNNNDMADQ